MAVLSALDRGKEGAGGRDMQRVPGLQKAGAEARRSPLLEKISKSQPLSQAQKGSFPALAESTQGEAYFTNTSWEP